VPRRRGRRRGTGVESKTNGLGQQRRKSRTPEKRKWGDLRIGEPRGGFKGWGGGKWTHESKGSLLFTGDNNDRKKNAGQWGGGGGKRIYRKKLREIIRKTIEIDKTKTGCVGCVSVIKIKTGCIGIGRYGNENSYTTRGKKRGTEIGRRGLTDISVPKEKKKIKHHRQRPSETCLESFTLKQEAKKRGRGVEMGGGCGLVSNSSVLRAKVRLRNCKRGKWRSIQGSGKR